MNKIINWVIWGLSVSCIVMSVVDKDKTISAIHSMTGMVLSILTVILNRIDNINEK